MLKLLIILLGMCVFLIADEDVEAKKYMQEKVDSHFGVKPYKVNYILPFGYRAGEYTSYIPSDKYTNIEAELQVSLKISFAKNLLGLDEKYYGSYSHRAFWQVYADSSPFRETNYNPELFVVFPIDDTTRTVQMKQLQFGYSHISNGQGNIEESKSIDPSTIPDELKPYFVNRSRSINLLYASAAFEYKTLLSEFKIWSPLPDAGGESDNPNLMLYTGYTGVKLSYFFGKHLATVDGRMNFETGLGAVEATYSYPLVEDVFLYAKIFSGYGESMIDYDNAITKFSIGFSFSR